MNTHVREQSGERGTGWVGFVRNLELGDGISSKNRQIMVISGIDFIGKCVSGGFLLEVWTRDGEEVKF